MSQGSNRRATQALDSTTPGKNDLLFRLFKIASLAAKAHSNPKFANELDFTLRTLREAHSLTKPWLEDAKKELERRGLLQQHDAVRSWSTDSHNPWLFLLAKLAVMQFQLLRQIDHEEKHLVRSKMLKEMFRHLVTYVEEVEEGIARLESRLERRSRRRQRHERRRHGSFEKTAEDDVKAYESHLEEGRSTKSARRRSLEKGEYPVPDGYQYGSRPVRADNHDTSHLRQSAPESPKASNGRAGDSPVRVPEQGQGFIGSGERNRAASLIGSLLSNLSRTRAHKSNSASGRPPVFNPGATHANPAQERTEDAAPYDHDPTASMPAMPESVSSRTSSRQTRAPTMSTTRSEHLNEASPVDEGVPLNHKEDHYGRDEDACAPGQPQHAHSRSRSKASSAFSRIQTMFSGSSKSRKPSMARGGQAHSTRSPYGEPTGAAQSQMPNHARSTHGDGPSRSHVASLASSQNTVIPPPSQRSSRGRERGDSVRTNDHLPQDLPPEEQQRPSAESNEHSRVPPPSGMSTHAGSQRHSKASSRRTTSSRPGSSISRRAGGSRGSRANTINDIEDDISEVPYMGYRRPQRRKKCHHDEGDAPSHCSSVASTADDHCE